MTAKKVLKESPDLEDYTIPLYNIQFHVTAVKGLWVSASPPSSPTAPRWFPGFPIFHRVVRVTAKGDRYTLEKHTDSVPEQISTWNENLTQMGPLRDSDRVTFRVEKRLPVALPGHSITVATSKEYSLRTLLLMQGKQGPMKDVRIPLETTHADNVEATLMLQVREPTTSFVSKQWLHEAKKLQGKLQSNH